MIKYANYTMAQCILTTYVILSYVFACTHMCCLFILFIVFCIMYALWYIIYTFDFVIVDVCVFENVLYNLW